MEPIGGIRTGSATAHVPRKLSTHQKAVLIQVLLTFPDETVGVCYAPSVGDAMAYAQDFLTIFKAVNWTVDHAQACENIPPSSSGLVIVLPKQQLPASAEALRDSLRIYNLEVAIVRDRADLCSSNSFAFAVTQA